MLFNGRAWRAHRDGFHLFLYGAVLGLLVPSTLCGQSEKTTFSIKESVTYAVANNPSLEVVRLENEIIHHKVREIFGEGLPQITSTLTYQYNPAVQRLFLPNFLAPAVYEVLETENLATLPANANFGNFAAGFGTKHSSNIALNVQQILFDMSYFLSLRASRKTVDYAEKSYKEAETALVATVKKTYYLILYAEKQQRLLQKNYERLATLLTQQRKMYENGFAEKVDIDRLTVSLNDMALQVKDAGNEVKKLRMLLNVQMGLAAQHPTVLTDTLQEQNVDIILEQTQQVNTTANAAIQKLAAVVALRNLQYKQQAYTLIPTLSLTSSLGYNSGSEEINDFLDSNLWYKYANLGVRLNVPVFSGFSRLHRIKQQRLAWLQAQKNTRIAAMQLTVSQVEHRQRLITRVEMVSQRRENKQLAQSVYDITKKRYQQGVGSYLEVLDASTTLIHAETQYYEALYEALSAMVDVEKAYGLLKVDL